MKIFLLVVVVLYGLSVDHTQLGQNNSLQLSLLKTACVEHDIDCNMFMRIAYVESRYDVKAFNKNRNGTVDVGIFQINSIHHNDCFKSGHDVYTFRGNVYCAAKLVSKLKRYKHIDKNWIGRYHSKTPTKKLAYISKLEKVKL